MTSSFAKDKLRAILWDIDGTVFSAEKLLLFTYQETFRDFAKQARSKLVVPTMADIMPQIGRPVREIFANLAPDLTSEEQNALSLRILASLVKQITYGKGEYYPEMSETLQELHRKGYIFFSVSNGRYPYVEAILRASQTFSYFQPITSLNNVDIKTKDDLVKHILTKNNILPEEAVLIGDRFTDRDAAVKNGIDFIATAYGHGSPLEWEGARVVIERLSDLKKILK